MVRHDSLHSQILLKDLAVVHYAVRGRYQKLLSEVVHDQEETSSEHRGKVHPLDQFSLPRLELPTSQGKSVDHQNYV